MKTTAGTGFTISDSSNEMYKRTLEEMKSKKAPKSKISDLYHSYNKYNKELSFIPPVFEPKTNNRWVLSFPNKLKIPQWFVKSVLRPSYPFDGTFQVTLYDPIWYEKENSLIKYLLSKNKKGIKIKLDLLDPTGVVIERWVLKKCYIKKADWSFLDYSDSNPVTITLDISYDEIILVK